MSNQISPLSGNHFLPWRHEKRGGLIMSFKNVSIELQSFQQLDLNFKKKIRMVQADFLSGLLSLKNQLINRLEPNSETFLLGKKLYNELFEAQKQFFTELQPNLSEAELNQKILVFRKTCKKLLSELASSPSSTIFHDLSKLLAAKAGSFQY